MFKDRISTPKPGNILLSEPFLKDSNFIRTVLLLCEHGNAGSVGFILNKPTALQIEDLVEGIAPYNREVYLGGPVAQDTLHFLYFGNQVVKDSTLIDKDVWWGGDFNELIQKIQDQSLPINQVFFFLGYSGWEEGQLAQELKEGAWIVYPDSLDEAIIHLSAAQIWKTLMRNMGGEFQIQANYPIDSRLN